MSQTPASTSRVVGYAIGAVLLAALFGLGAGAIMARLSPEDKFSWAGLAIAPLWLLLEVLFEGVIAIMSAYTKALRIVSSISVVAGLYIAWFLVRY